MKYTFYSFLVGLTSILVVMHTQVGSSHVIREQENIRHILALGKMSGLNPQDVPIQSLDVPNVVKVGRVRRWAIPADIQDSLCPPGYIRRSDRITCYHAEIEDDYDTSEPKKIT